MSDFRTWLFKQRERNDSVGKFAVCVFNSTGWDGTQSSLKRDLEANHPNLMKYFERVREEFRNKPKETPTSARGPYLLEHGSFSKIFKKKTDVQKFYQELKDNSLNEVLKDEQRDAVLALFQYHPNCIITENTVISVEKASTESNYCYHFDGEEYSYIPALSSLGHEDDEICMRKYKLRKFFNTARYIIRDQIPPTVAGHHHDHVNFFSHLLRDWFLAVGPERIRDIEYSGKGSECRFVPEQLNDSWYTYHQTNAILQCVPIKDNLSRRPPTIDWALLY